ncbi:MAG: RNHCP domain-containing protein [Phycisphaerales bacterium]|nr:RNHCP domain-containing protein [Phycisphaerales bacterium]
MKHHDRNAQNKGGFSCVHCKAHIPYQSFGTKQRNHCPVCLWSRHVDDLVGDRRSVCNQPMEPVSIAARTDGEWAIVHRCTGCRQLRMNRIAGDDDELALLAMALRPLTDPAFPLDMLPMYRVPKPTEH